MVARLDWVARPTPTKTSETIRDRIAMTTRSSIKVNPARRARVVARVNLKVIDVGAVATLSSPNPNIIVEFMEFQ
jgi:hypothetical protein